MIKVISLTGDAFDICINSKHQEQNAYESSILNQFLDDGWNIKDWKMCQSSNVYRTWTFILEKY